MWVPTVGIFLAACAGAEISGGTYVNRSKGFTVPLPPTNWSTEAGGKSDLLLRHAQRQAGMSIHAICDGIPPDRSLDVVSRHLFFGVQHQHVFRREHRVTASVDALDVVLRGEVGGRELLLHGYTMRESGCIYDLVLFAAPEDYLAADEDFEALVRGFTRSGGTTR